MAALTARGTQALYESNYANTNAAGTDYPMLRESVFGPEIGLAPDVNLILIG